MRTSRVLIVDDHELLAHSLDVALRETGVAVQRVTGPTAEAILERATAWDPDVVLLDLHLSGDVGSGLSLIAPLSSPTCNVVMLTGSTDEIELAQCVRAGAVGLLSKTASFDELVTSIHEVMRHGSLLTEHERQIHLSRLREHEARDAQRIAPFTALTPREAEVLGELMRGRAAADIARGFVVSTATVRSQIRAVLHKLGVSSQLAATAKAHEAGWTPPS